MEALGPSHLVIVQDDMDRKLGALSWKEKGSAKYASMLRCVGSMFKMLSKQRTQWDPLCDLSPWNRRLCATQNWNRPARLKRQESHFRLCLGRL